MSASIPLNPQAIDHSTMPEIMLGRFPLSRVFERRQAELIGKTLSEQQYDPNQNMLVPYYRTIVWSGSDEKGMAALLVKDENGKPSVVEFDNDQVEYFQSLQEDGDICIGYPLERLRYVISQEPTNAFPARPVDLGDGTFLRIA